MSVTLTSIDELRRLVADPESMSATCLADYDRTWTGSPLSTRRHRMLFSSSNVTVTESVAFGSVIYVMPSVF